MAINIVFTACNGAANRIIDDHFSPGYFQQASYLNNMSFFKPGFHSVHRELKQQKNSSLRNRSNFTE